MTNEGRKRTRGNGISGRKKRGSKRADPHAESLSYHHMMYGEQPSHSQSRGVVCASRPQPHFTGKASKA